MSISLSLSNALSGLTAAARGAEVVSSNLANAMTDGYGRRSLNLSARSVAGVGAGVQVDGITRHVDRGVISDRRLAEAGMQRDGQTAGYLVRLESIVGAPGDQGSLSARLVALEQSLTTAAADPAAEVRLDTVLDRLSGLSGAMNTASDGIQDLRTEADNAIASQVEALNSALKQVERLNGDVQRLRAAGHEPATVIDERQRVIDSIAAIVPVRELERGMGQVALMTPSGQTLLEGRAVEVGFSPARVVTADMTRDSGALSGLTIDGEPVRDGGIGRLDGGTLGSAFALRDEVLTEAQAGLDALALDMVQRLSDPATDPSLPAGAPGLLTDDGGAADPADLAGLAGRLQVNAAIDPSAGGELRLIRDGLGAPPGPTGSSAQIDRWLSALSETRSLGPSAGSAAAHFDGLSSRIGTARVTAEQERSFESARWETLRETELANGVDSDHELQMLMRIEQAYAANAKVMQTIDIMMQRLMEI